MPNFLKLLVCEHLIVVNMSWEEVAKEMEGVEGVISMMDEDIEADEEGKKDGNATSPTHLHLPSTPSLASVVVHQAMSWARER